MSSQQRDSGGGNRGMGRGVLRPPQPGIRTNTPGRQYGGRRGGGPSQGAAPKKVIPIEDDSSGPTIPTQRQQPTTTSWANVVKKQGGPTDKDKVVTVVKGVSNGEETSSAELQFGELPKGINLVQNGDTSNGDANPQQQSQQQQQQPPNSTVQQVSAPQQQIMQQQIMPPQQQPAPGMPPQMYQMYPPWQYYTTPPHQMQFYSAQQQQEYTAWHNYFRQFAAPVEYAAQWAQNAGQAGGYGYQPYPATQTQQQAPTSQQPAVQYPYPSPQSQSPQATAPAATETDSASSKGEAVTDSKSQSQAEKPKIIIKKPTSGAIPIVNPGTNEVVNVVAPATSDAAPHHTSMPEEDLSESQDAATEEIQSLQKQDQQQQIVNVEDQPVKHEENISDKVEEEEQEDKQEHSIEGDDNQLEIDDQNSNQQKDSEIGESVTVTPTPTMAQVIAQIPENQPSPQHQQVSVPQVPNSGISSVLEASAAPYTPQYAQLDINNYQISEFSYAECNGTKEAQQTSGPYFYDRVSLLKLQFSDIEQSEEIVSRLQEFQGLVSRKSLTSHQSSIPRVASGIARKNSGLDKWGGRGGRLEGTRSGGLDRWNSGNREQVGGWTTRKQSPGPAVIRQPSVPNPNIHKATNAYKVGNISDDEQSKQRTFQSLLNRLTPTNFDKLYWQITEVQITSPQTLKGLIHQIFDKALVETSFSSLYSDLCQRLTQDLPAFPEPETEEQQQAAAAGQPQKKRLINFRRLLLNKCQEEFEKGSYAMQNKETDSDKPRAEETKLEQARRKAEELKDRRRALGNMQFIGYLFSKGMLTEQILHDCIQLLLKEMQNPKGEDLEQLCKLLFTVGALLDSPKARMKENMGVYMKRIISLTNNPQLDSRIKFMLIEVVETRQRGWEARRKVEGPKTIKEIHKDAAADMKRSSSQKELPSSRRYKSQEVTAIVSKSRSPAKQYSPEEFRPVESRNSSKLPPAAAPVPKSSPLPAKSQGAWSQAGRAVKSVNFSDQIQQSSEDEQQAEQQAASKFNTTPGDDVILQQLRDFADYDAVQNEIKMLLEEFQINLEHKLDNQEAVEDALKKLSSALEQLHSLLQQNSIPQTNTFHWVLEIALGKRHFKDYLWIIVRYFSNQSAQFQKISGDIETSIKMALQCAYKYCEDNPFYSTMLGFVLSKFVENGVLDFRKVSEFIMQAGEKEREEDPPPLVDEGGAIPIICETLRGLLDIMGIDETQEMWRNSGFQIQQFAPEGDDFVIKTVVKQCGLEGLFPSYV